MAIPIKMPQLGESIVEGTLVRWLKEPGDAVRAYEPLLEVETDKVVTEVSAPENGVLLQILVPAGETVAVGAVLAYLGQPGEAVPSQSEAPETARVEGQDAAPAASSGPRSYTPAVLRLAEEHNLAPDELAAIPGSGRGGRVSKKDVLRYLKARQAAEPASPPAAAPEPAAIVSGQTLELTPMRAAIAEHMLRSVQTSAHATSVFEVDMSRVVAYRQAHREEFARQGLELTYTAFFVQAAVEALRAHPLANASLQEGKIALHRHINIGLAVAVEDGLLVPVIHRAEELSLKGLARAINDLAGRARSRKLKPDDVQGGTFTVTNPGMQGALFGNAIIHQPQTAILGVGAIVKRPVVIDEAIAIRPMVYLSLTYDHRLLDGFGANQVLAAIRDFLENYR
ncbi:MAG: dihydrolipoamide acetyltransferase family protein [Anaerolineae bacterium]